VPLRLLPLFPLPLVLFPGAPLPLHVFEPRYRQMLSDCLAGDGRFGVLLRPEGVAERDLPPGHVGCIAELDRARVQTLADGRSNIVVTGVERFSLQRFVASPAPYLVGEVTDVPDAGEDPALLRPLDAEVRALFARVGRAARSISDDPDPLPDLPTDPTRLAFGIASVIDMPLEERQKLLASRSPLERLQQVEQVLRSAVLPLESRAHVHGRSKSNGHGPHADG
jgi:Lon protease-like protein